MRHPKTLLAASLFALLVVLTPAEARRGILDYMGGTTVMVDGQTPRDGSGNQGSISRTLPRFTRIELRSAERLKVVRGERFEATLSGDDNLLELISTAVRGETLVVEARGGYRSRKPIDIEVTMPRLTALALEGSSDATLAALDADRFKLSLDGSGNVTATGRTGRLDIDLNGSGNADFVGVDAARVEAAVNGSGNIALGKAPVLDAEINGSGDIVYSGNPETLKSRVNGSGSIRSR